MRVSTGRRQELEQWAAALARSELAELRSAGRAIATLCTENEALERRLEQLERDNRRLRRYTTTMLVVVAMVLGLGTALIWYSVRSGLPGSPLTVSARQFVLRDSDGTMRGAWGLGEPEVQAGNWGDARLFGAVPVPARITAKDAGRSWAWTSP